MTRTKQGKLSPATSGEKRRIEEALGGFYSLCLYCLLFYLENVSMRYLNHTLLGLLKLKIREKENMGKKLKRGEKRKKIKNNKMVPKCPSIDEWIRKIVLSPYNEI